MHEEEIEEWYSEQLENATKEFLDGLDKKENREALEEEYRAKLKGLRQGYTEKYEEHWEEEKHKGPHKFIQLSQKVKKNFKSTKEFLKKTVKYPSKKIGIIKKTSAYVLTKNKLEVAYDLHKFKYNIRFENFLDRWHLSYPLFLTGRSYYKLKLRIGQAGIAIKLFLSETVEDTVAVIVDISKSIKSRVKMFFKRIIRFTKKIFNAIIHFFTKLFSVFKRKEKKEKDKKQAEEDIKEGKKEEKPSGERKLVKLIDETILKKAIKKLKKGKISKEKDKSVINK